MPPREIVETHYVAEKYGLVTETKLFRKTDMARLQPKSTMHRTWDDTKAKQPDSSFLFPNKKAELGQKAWGSRGYFKVIDKTHERVKNNIQKLEISCPKVFIEIGKSKMSKFSCLESSTVTGVYKLPKKDEYYKQLDILRDHEKQITNCLVDTRFHGGKNIKSATPILLEKPHSSNRLPPVLHLRKIEEIRYRLSEQEPQSPYWVKDVTDCCGEGICGYPYYYPHESRNEDNESKLGATECYCGFINRTKYESYISNFFTVLGWENENDSLDHYEEDGGKFSIVANGGRTSKFSRRLHFKDGFDGKVPWPDYPYGPIGYGATAYPYHTDFYQEYEVEGVEEVESEESGSTPAALLLDDTLLNSDNFEFKISISPSGTVMRLNGQVQHLFRLELEIPEKLGDCQPNHLQIFTPEIHLIDENHSVKIYENKMDKKPENFEKKKNQQTKKSRSNKIASKEKSKARRNKYE